MSIEAVIFDLDGVIVASEEIWDDVRERYVREAGGRYDDGAQRAMMGMSSHEWSRFIHDELGVSRAPEQISADVVSLMIGRYHEELPLIPGAAEAVGRMAERWPLAVASSSNRPLIDVVLEPSGLARRFQATVSSEEVGRGKPWPDVYLEAARRLGVPAERCVAVEDSHNGIRSAKAAGMTVLDPQSELPTGQGCAGGSRPVPRRSRTYARAAGLP
jgi:beta-phosphoglucomutase-like phosphatase (HAD superfamily)